MNPTEDLPESDRVDGAPHPRETVTLVGQDSAERAFLAACNGGKMHHAWLISGPRGIGKATLAWRIARFLLATDMPACGTMFDDPTPQAETLDIPADHPVARRMMALAEPRMFLLRPGWDEKAKRLRQAITVDEVRKLKDFFHMSAADGGRRAVIVDCADDLNVNAANALLKLLEEPPADAVLLLVSHQPSGLLPTIRSRCRQLRCKTLSPDEMKKAMTAAGAEIGSDHAALSELSCGSVGEAVRFRNLDGMQTYARLVSMLGALPDLDRPAALRLAESAVGKGNQARFDMVLHLIDLFLARTARTGVTGPPLVEAAPGEAELMQRLAPAPEAGRIWAQLQQQLGARARHGKSVNLDPAALVLDILFRIRDTAAKMQAR